MVNPELNQDNLINRVQFATSQAERSRKTAESYLKGNVYTRLWVWIQCQAGIVPEWAENHIKATKELEKAVAEFHKVGKPIPENAVKILKECREVLGAVSHKVDSLKLNELIGIERPTVKGSAGLLSGLGQTQTIPKHAFEWQINLGLMLNAYDRAESPELKKEIRFLILNYLAKAAPISFERLEILGVPDEQLEEFKKLFQLGFFTEHGYHRERNIFDTTLFPLLQKSFAGATGGTPSYMVDTIDIAHLFPLHFHPIDLSIAGGSEQMSQIILQYFKDSTAITEDTRLPKGMLLDLTALLSEKIITEGDPDKERAFNASLEEINTLIEEMIKRAVEKIKHERPDLVKSPEDEQLMIQLIKDNTVAVCRNQLKENVGVIKVLPPLKTRSLVDFINQTGVRIGGISARFNYFDFYDFKKTIASSPDLQVAEYSVPGSQDTVYFPKPMEMTKTYLFTRFSDKMDDLYQSDPNSPVAILGKSTLELAKGLIEEIGEKGWEELNRDPVDLTGQEKTDHLVRRMMLQTSLYRLTQHLASAENNMQDFAKFTEAIELVHCEIATLLQLTSPFDPAQFQDLYQQQLSFIPEELKDKVTAGVTKSAMNTFAGICSAVMESTPGAQMVHGKDSYFEEIAVIGNNRSIDQVLANPEVKSVQLYVGEFNHNINIHLDYHHYMPGDVEEDIKRLLKEKPSEHLTVAIDSTIDLVNSPKAQNLLKRFSKDIQEGRLNIIFFRSGQKFEMLGMDNYYGAPFYMINNGDIQWKRFERLQAQDTFKTDPLSLQWYCLVNKYAPKQLDDYRATIIKNSRDLLDKVPQALREEDSPVRVSTVDPGMDPAFIDIKIVDPSRFSRSEIERIFYEKMIAAGRKAHSRGSFGFYHPNFNFINDQVLRINPGLDPKDNEIILEVLKEIALQIEAHA